jgi:hypothetical protein
VRSGVAGTAANARTLRAIREADEFGRRVAQVFLIARDNDYTGILALNKTR